MLKHYGFAVLVLTTVLSVGCGSGQVGLDGRVTYSDTNEPLEMGAVCFVDGNSMSRGNIGEDGKYVVGTLTDTDGLPKGTYKVYITGAHKTVETGGNYQTVPLIDEKYENAETSGITFTVDGSKKTFDFTVDRAK